MTPRHRQQLIVPWTFAALFVAGSADASPGDQLFKLSPSDPAAEDFFGWKVAASGNLALIGSPQDDRMFPNGRIDENAGAAYLFDMNTGQQLRKLTASDGEQQDLFGSDVDIDNNIAIIGARFDDDNGTATGSAYLYDATTGSQLFKLVASDADTFDLFGDSVGISGNIAIVGAPGDDEKASGAGAAYLFNVTTGQQISKLTTSDPVEADGVAMSVAISDRFAMVGLRAKDSFGTNSGAAYVFDVTTGQELFKLTPSDAAELDSFGNAIAISGNVAIVGAVLHDASATDSGAAYLFDLLTGQQLHKLMPSDAGAQDLFGFSVAIDGNTAIVGTGRDVFDADPRAGSAYVFDVATGQERLRLTGFDTVDRDRFGQSVAVSGKVALIGAGTDNNPFLESGSAYVIDVVPEPGGATSVIIAIALVQLACWRVEASRVCRQVDSLRLLRRRPMIATSQTQSQAA